MSPGREQRLRELARAEGFDFAAIAPFAPPPHHDALAPWLEAGHAGQMAWLERKPELRADPRGLRDWGRSLLVVGLNIHQAGPSHELLTEPSRGRIAAYAWGRDYHKVMGAMLRRLAASIVEEFGPASRAQGFVDTAPILERPLAAAAHKGFIGKHTLLIHRHFGSRVMLGELLTSLELEPEPPPLREPMGCGTCHLCAAACPTGALEQPYVNQAQRCISYLTIELRGSIPRQLRPALGNWVFGCDLCQLACPYNARLKQETEIADLQLPGIDRAAPRLAELLALDDEAFLARFAGSPVMRAKRVGMVRNAAVAAGNWGSGEALDPLSRCLSDDPEPTVREHAAWALGRLSEQRAQARAQLEAARRAEEDDVVLREIELALADLDEP